MNRLAIFLIHFYQRYISRLLGPRCRYYPTCSEYAKLSYERFGLFYASYLTIRRLLRCNPFSQGGVDEPPL